MVGSPSGGFIWGAGGAALTPEQIALQRAIIARKKTDTSPVGSWMEGAARVADALGDKFVDARLNKAETANAAYDASLASPLAEALAGGVAAYPASVAAGGGSMAPDATGVASLPAAASDIKAGLIARGLPEHVADGFVMNFADESGLNPGINEKNPTVAGSRGGYGLYQLTGPRRVAYEQFAKQQGVSPDSPDAQLDFLVSELKGPEAGAAAKIFAAPDSGSAAAAIATNFLRPNANSLAQRVAKYTSGNVPQIPLPVQTASLDPSVGMGGALPGAEQGIGGVAYEQVPPQFTPEQLAAGNPLLPNIPAPELTRTTPSVPMSADQMQPMGGVGVGALPAGTGGVPVLDVTQQPALSAAAGLPVADGGGAISGQARVAQALQAYPIQQQAAAGDQMVAGADQTLQPSADQSGAFPPAPVGAPVNTAPVAQPGYLDAAGGGQAQAPQGNPIAAAVRAISDPRASPQTKAIAELVIKQAQARQAAVAEQQVWQQRQAYEAQQQANDPKRQLEIQKLQREVNAPVKRETITVNGTVLDAQTMQPVYTAPEKIPDSVRSLQLRAEAAGLKPGTKEYGDFLLNGDSKDTNVTVNTGEGNKFFNTLDEKNAGIFSGLSDTGIQAKSKLGMVTALEKRLEKAPQGGIGALKAWAGELGIPFEGTDDIQAATALINRMVPEQRQPGSGTMSDADLALFKASLPRILNQPNGNKMIIGDLKSLSEYQIKMGEIADRVADRAMTPQEARDAIRALPNPLQGFLDRDNSEKMDQQDEGWKEISPGVRVRPVK